MLPAAELSNRTHVPASASRLVLCKTRPANDRCKIEQAHTARLLAKTSQNVGKMISKAARQVKILLPDEHTATNSAWFKN